MLLKKKCRPTEQHDPNAQTWLRCCRIPSHFVLCWRAVILHHHGRDARRYSTTVLGSRAERRDRHRRYSTEDTKKVCDADPLVKIPPLSPYLWLLNASCTSQFRHSSRQQVQHETAKLRKRRRKSTVQDSQRRSTARCLKYNLTRKLQKARIPPDPKTKRTPLTMRLKKSTATIRIFVSSFKLRLRRLANRVEPKYGRLSSKNFSKITLNIFSPN